jgi:hypothetical protein
MTQFGHSVHEKTSLCVKASFLNLLQSGRLLVDVAGIEPATPCLQNRCSPN